MPRLSATLWVLAAALGLGACASAPKPADREQRLATARVLQQAIESGRVLGAADPAFTPVLEEASLAWLLFRGPAPLPGARRLLDLSERGHELAGVFLGSSAAERLPALTASEAFRSGQFFNSYDGALFRPFFRHSLLDALNAPEPDEDYWLAWLEPLELALRLTPRYAGVYPNLLSPALRKDLQAYVKANPQGSASDRFQMLLIWDQRNGAWERERQALDERLKQLAEDSEDELLKLELKDALLAPRARPERAFWMSLLLPGLGQVSHGDLQGGILLGGLTASAWAWMASKLGQAGALDGSDRQVAYGDAAWAASLAVLGHGFTAMNAAEQARFINIVVEWDLLSKDRLNDGSR
jgi:hypothetical protein